MPAQSRINAIIVDLITIAWVRSNILVTTKTLSAHERRSTTSALNRELLEALERIDTLSSGATQDTERPMKKAKPIWFMVEAIRAADNTRVIFGPFETDLAAEAFRRRAQTSWRQWEFTVQEGSPAEALPLLTNTKSA